MKIKCTVTPEEGDDPGEVARIARYLSGTMTRDVDLLVSLDRRMTDAGVITMTMQAPMPAKAADDDDL